MAKLSYHTDEAAEILGVSVAEVRNMIKSGKLQARKSPTGHHKFLIPKDQEIFSGLVPSDEEIQEEVPVVNQTSEPFSRYIRDNDHLTEVFQRIMDVKSSLKIATANLKNFMLTLPTEDGRTEQIRFAELVKRLVDRGVKVQIMCMAPMFFYKTLREEYPELEKDPRFTLRQLPHLHMKVFIFDNEVSYIGSANITGAALNTGHSSRWNHEAGILASGNDVFLSSVDHFNTLWSSDNIHRYSYKHFKRDYAEFLKKHPDRE